MRRPLFIILFLTCSSLLTAQKADTLKPRITRQWTLSGDYAEEVNLPMDTTFSLFHHYRTSDRYSTFNVYQGNYGLPLYQMNFFDRVTDPDKFLYRYLYPFMHTTDNPVFMNTQVPFTEMVFTYAGPRETAEQTFRVRHSQNINRFINFGLVYDIVYCLGQYSYQRSEDKTFGFHFSYTGDKYKLYFSAGINNLLSLENGGVTDKTQLSTFKTRDVEVNLGSLNKAENFLKNRNLLIVQKYSLNRHQSSKPDTSSGKSKPEGFRLNGDISHIFTWETTKRAYTDSYPQGGFYDTAFISTTRTFDTVSLRVMKNTIRFDFSTDERRKFRLGGGVGIRNELLIYAEGKPVYDSVRKDSVAWHRNNNILVGRLFNNIGNKFRWIANGELFLTGYRAGDLKADGVITRDFDFHKGRAEWNITGGISSLTPSDFYGRWIGNNFHWSNNFSREFRIYAGTEFLYPARKIYLRFNYGIINNYTYFGSDALPAQYSSGLSVISLMLNKELSVWKLHLSNEVLVQVSGNRRIVDLPLVTLRSAGYFEHNIHFKITDGYLLTQLGVEVFYYTSYNGYNWMPATATYYQGQNNSTGNYPYLNAFLNLKLKRTRIFVMLDHLNSGMNGYNYFMVPGYPMNIRCFRYGLAWTFYD